MHKEITWRELKALNDLFINGKSIAKIQEHPFILYLYEKGLLDHRLGNSKVLITTDKFEAFYRKNLDRNYRFYKAFLESNELETDARKSFTEDDIKTLIFINDNKLEMLNKLPPIKIFSSEFFHGKGSKYLENKKSLRYAVCKILGIDKFPGEDNKTQQWRFVVDHPNPKAVVLCENLSFLKLPWQAEENYLELWYVGGNNIGIIDKIGKDKLSKPLFYSGDWDFAGLQIYLRIKTKFLLKEKAISLLFPTAINKRLPVDSPHHESKWVHGKNFSGLDKSKFNEKEVELITSLINSDEWIEEESNDLVKMVEDSLNTE